MVYLFEKMAVFQTQVSIKIDTIVLRNCCRHLRVQNYNLQINLIGSAEFYFLFMAGNHP